MRDGAGLLEGKDTFTRIFGVPPIQLEAADEIERAGDLAMAVSQATDVLDHIASILGCEPGDDIVDALEAMKRRSERTVAEIQEGSLGNGSRTVSTSRSPSDDR